MLIIRLQRTGKKNQADFRIVLAQKTASAAKKFVEVLGSYNPRKKLFAVKNQDRLKYWLAQHVELSPTLHNLLVTNKLLDAKKVRAFNTPKKSVEPMTPTTSASAEASADKPAADAATPPQAGGETAAVAPTSETTTQESAPASETPAPAEQPAQ
jgi:small subunit ribosomal protein S16